MATVEFDIAAFIAAQPAIMGLLRAVEARDHTQVNSRLFWIALDDLPEHQKDRDERRRLA